jgi:hypothetical protein
VSANTVCLQDITAKVCACHIDMDTQVCVRNAAASCMQRPSAGVGFLAQPPNRAMKLHDCNECHSKNTKGTALLRRAGSTDA